LSELKSERDHINTAISALEALTGHAAHRVITMPKSAATPAKGRKKRNLTAAGRKRLSENMKRRWAERRKAAAKLARAA
jgi:hypothetical protein